LQPFVPLVISATGKSELLTLTTAESNAAMAALPGQALLSGMYLNELLIRLLHKDDPHSALFDAYAKTLTALSQGEALLPTLRTFELFLLSELGYGISFEQVEKDQWYRFDPQQGFLESYKQTPGVFFGEQLLALEKRQFDSADVLQTAKRLVRLALHELLGGKPLKTRELFI